MRYAWLWIAEKRWSICTTPSTVPVSDSVMGTKVWNSSSFGRRSPSWYVPSLERTLTVCPSSA